MTVYQKQIISNFTFIFDCYKNVSFLKKKVQIWLFCFSATWSHCRAVSLADQRGLCLLYVVCGMGSAHVAPGWTLVDGLHGLFKMPVEIFFCLNACFMAVACCGSGFSVAGQSGSWVPPAYGLQPDFSFGPQISTAKEQNPSMM